MHKIKRCWILGKKLRLSLFKNKWSKLIIFLQLNFPKVHEANPLLFLIFKNPDQYLKQMNIGVEQKKQKTNNLPSFLFGFYMFFVAAEHYRRSFKKKIRAPGRRTLYIYRIKTGKGGKNGEECFEQI